MNLSSAHSVSAKLEISYGRPFSKSFMLLLKKGGIDIKLAMIFILLIPIVLPLLLKVSIFKFAPGNVESLIGFWGSYFGAVIGATVVYFVARFQIEKQFEQQESVIEKENEKAVKREMKQFLITTRLGKYEDIVETCERLSYLNIQMNNELRSFVFALERQKKGHTVNIDEYRGNVYDKHIESFSIMTLNITKLITLSNYVPGLRDSCIEISSQFRQNFDEAKHCYEQEKEYRKYVKLDDKQLLKHTTTVQNSLIDIIADLNVKISEELDLIEENISL